MIETSESETLVLVSSRAFFPPFLSDGIIRSGVGVHRRCELGTCLLCEEITLIMSLIIS